MLLRMAWRNLGRNRRRSVVTTAAMTLALWVMVLYSGLITGYWRGMERSIVELEVGDAQIFALGYLAAPSLYCRIDQSEALLQRLDALGYPASARLLGGGLAASGDQSAGISLRGVDATREARVSGLPEAIAEGRWLDPTDEAGVVIGRRLAQSLNVGVGGEIVVVSQGADGSLANDLFRVRGILRTIADATDRTAVFLNASAFRELMVVPGGVHQIAVRRPPELALPDFAARVRQEARGLDVRTWRQLLPTVATMLDSTRSMVWMIFGIVYIAVTILVLNATLMAVFERVRELGVLKALGFGPLGVLGLILLEAGLQLALAVTGGLLLAVPGMFYLTRVGIDVGALGGMSMMGHAMPPVWHGVYTVEALLTPILMLIGMVLLGAFYPALKAAWVQPVTAMRHI